MAIDLSALSAREALTAIYIGYYDRAADPAGIAFWEGVVANTSLDLVAITSDFATQAETQAVHPFFASPSESAAGAFITTLYLNLFNREPDDAGLAFWTEQLQGAVNGTGTLTVGEIITQIIEGAVDTPADPADPASVATNDRTTILNKIEVGLDWTTAAEASDIDFTTNAAARTSAADIIDAVTDQQSSVVAARAITDDFFAEDGNNGGQDGSEFELGFGSFDPTTGGVNGFDNLVGTSGSDTFHAESGALISGDRIDGGSGRDALTAFFESEGFGGAPISARTTSVESVYVTNQAVDFSNGDNNIEGGGQDVAIDGGRMVGVDRWEDFDSRADLVIEDARDDDDTDGTFTGDITVAMVSTDPGNVDYAVYFDGPVNTAANDDSIFIEVIDQNNSNALSAAAITAATTGNLTDAQLTEFSILVDGVRVTINLDPAVVGTAHFGADATYTDLLNAINTALDNTTLADGSVLGDDLTASIGSSFFENIGNDNDAAIAGSLQQVFGLRIVLRSDSGAELGDAGVSSTGQGDIVVVSRDDPADVAQAISNEENIVEELIRLNIELDDVGKGSTGGDLVAGAMSTGRNDGDRTSDSIGIQQFDIDVDRSSNLQTINSTNNALEVVNIQNGENSGINNTTTAADELIGDLTVRGVANPGSQGNGTNDNFPGAVREHNEYGFTDVRVINAAAMIGSVDITAELTEEIVEKYLNIQDGQANGDADDRAFTYTLGTNDDEFFLNMSSDALNSAGTGSREDFDMVTSGGGGDDVITTNVGTSLKLIDEQGQDHYVMATDNAQGWYQNSVFSNAATFTVDGGAGNDTIWTNGWGDKVIADGSGNDVIYTDNSAVFQLSSLLTTIDRNLLEHDQIDYALGAAWVFNGEGPTSGATNDDIVLRNGLAANTALNSGTSTVTVSYAGVGGVATAAATGVYTATATIPVSQMSIVGTTLVTDEQAYNQAIKNAINSDPVLSQLLEAVDGVGNSLIVYSKTDGLAAVDNLDIQISTVSLNGTAGASATVRPAGYDTAAPGVTFGPFANDSVVESDNIINMAADGDADVVVLSTSDAAVAAPAVNGALNGVTDLNGASNEEINFADGNFGSDTIVNFDEGDGSLATAANEDVMDFLHIDYVAAAGNFGVIAADAIFVLAETVGTNSTAAEVATTYNGLLAGEEAIHIAYDVADDNTGTVYLVTGAGTAADDASVVSVGEISLIGTNWANLQFDNFA
jgi:hypothetical protein